MKRRRVLSAMVPASIGLSGCLSVLDDGSETSNEVELTEILLLLLPSIDETRVDIEVRIQWDEEIVHEAVYEIERDSAKRIPREFWPETSGEWEVAARIDDGEWSATSSESAPTGVDCTRLQGTIVQYGDNLGLSWGWAWGDC